MHLHVRTIVAKSKHGLGLHIEMHQLWRDDSRAECAPTGQRASQELAYHDGSAGLASAEGQRQACCCGKQHITAAIQRR
jgi:hypothetical protein